MRKRCLLVSTVALLAVLLMGCHYALIDIGSKSSTEWTAEFRLKGGKESHTINIPEGEKAEIRFALVMEEGTLSILVTDDNGKTVYEAKPEESDTFTIPLEKTGQYTILLNAEKLSGSYRINWGDPPDEKEVSQS